MIVLTCSEKNGKLSVEEMREGVMYFVDGEELTPLECTKLALFYALNCDKVLENTHEE